MGKILGCNELIMTNVVLKYIDLICSTRYSNKHSFFSTQKSFKSLDPSPRSITSMSNDSPVDIGSESSNQAQDLPIHEILKDIYVAVKSNNTEYFEPMILHYWQLQRLLEILRCNTQVLFLPAQQRINNAKINQLREDIRQGLHPDICRAKEQTIQRLEQENVDIQTQLEVEKEALRQHKHPQDQDNIQAVLVLSTLLKIIYRKGMSVPLLSDQFQLEEQQHECRELLSEYCDIVFDQTEIEFSTLFAVEPKVIEQRVPTILERISSELISDWAWVRGRVSAENEDDLRLKTEKYYVSRVLGAQTFHAFYNHFRLGGTRSRRLLTFLEPFFHNETYTALFKTVDPYLGFILNYFNWIFFVPRLSLNLSLLAHHLLNDAQLDPMERKLSRWTRFRAHWTRFWFELINDSYWILGALKICFWLPAGAMSAQGILLSLTIQFLDLFCSVIRAGVELYRLYKMADDLKALEPNHGLANDVNKRFWFETLALGYMVFHFSILLMSLCLTLPSMAMISTALPVVGAVCSVMMTVITFYMQAYFARRRETEFECKLEPLDNNSGSTHSPSGNKNTLTSRNSHTFA